MRNRPYRQSEELLERASRVIPLGTQTFSKSRTQFPHGVSPYYIVGGKGARVVDADGNTYLDFISALNAITLGYADADVDGAVRDQLDEGVLFSLPHPIEIEVAEAIRDMVPCAEMVRFGKNGSDATTAAIRIARAATGRDRVAVCGYHGWHDWYIGATTRNKGVPEVVQGLTHHFPYNDIDALHGLFQQHPGEIAAVIIEPMNLIEPADGYLSGLAELVRHEGAVLVFDEVITGFRYSLGGAQELFGVTPDLATFGKGLGNGMPISAVTGRAELMRETEEIFFSTTFAGETLSLAAAIAVIDKMRREPVIETLWRTGQRLAEGVRDRVRSLDLDDTVTLQGKAPWISLAFHDHPRARKEAIKTLLIKELIANGVLTAGSHNVCYAHDDADVALVLSAYDAALGTLAEALAGDALEADLPCPVIEPVFQARG